jgi:CubicO group peptidase (beta-lactamase class C family)
MTLLSGAIKRSLLLAVLAVFFYGTVPAQDSAGAAIDDYLKSLASEGRFMGSVMVTRDGKPVISKGYGMANIELDVPNSPKTRFRLGSVTKQFTAASILLLQERGKLSVQDSVCKFFDNCPEAWKDVTVHHLLSHTGGIPNFTSFPDYQKTMMLPVTMASLIARFRDKPLDFKPGEKWSYSNSGYVMLGYIIEKVAGESYESFLKKNIFGPLNMADSGYDHHDSVLKNRATGYSENCKGALNSAYLDMTIPHAAGALYSTTEDLARWNDAIHSDKLLSARSREMMMTVVKNNYAYGIGVDTVFNRRMISHGGGINGFSTFLARFPEEKINIIVLRNADFGNPAPGKMTRDIAAIMFGEKFQNPPTRVVASIDPRVLDAYVGKYQVMPNFILSVRKDGECLMTQATGQQEIEVFPESETTFFLKVVDAKITFVKDEKGVVNGLILNQGGERKAKKIE